MPDFKIDTVRASRDGHQYHEAWLARRALGLLLPSDGLYAIAVEGLSVEDSEDAGVAAAEIADATFYYGTGPDFAHCDRMEITQFKYSIVSQNQALRFSDARKTIVKFAAAEVDFIAAHGAEATTSKLHFVLLTNRPISPDLLEAIRAAAGGCRPEAHGPAQQFDALCASLSFNGAPLAAFASRITLLGQMGSLRSVEAGVAQVIADWSASDDMLVRARLGDLQALVRGKAGSKGQENNLIGPVDILGALHIAEETDLLPTPQALSSPGAVIARAQLEDFLEKSKAAPRWLVHAAGGIGKTVFVQSLADRLSRTNEVVLFDCFGGGAYRNLADARHRIERGLLHVVNELACRGLCDLVLPGSTDPSEVLRRSAQRFRQAIGVLRRSNPSAQLVIIIDAADNAAMEARRRNQLSFPQELLEYLSDQPAIDGLLMVVTARTERSAMAIGRASCEPYELGPFSLDEARQFIAARRSDTTEFQMEAIHRRSDGNPRVISNLIEADRSLEDALHSDSKIDLTQLINERIDRAVALVDQKNGAPESASAFLCALSVLPPPVPISELATAFGLIAAEIESFAADMSPLLERTRHGIIFRDEPTETLVEQKYGTKLNLLSGVVGRLFEAQSTSAYAARALPGLLLAMRKVDELRALAFDQRFPANLTGDVAKRAIRLNRLRTALAAAATATDYDAIVDLLVELSSVVAVDQRGEDYLLNNADLVAGLGDADSLRRLFESKASWAGTRHARLTIAYTTDGDMAEAYGHARRADEWLNWLDRQGRETHINGRPTTEEYVAVPLFLALRGRTTGAARLIARFYSDYGYKVACRLFEICRVSSALGKTPTSGRIIIDLVRCRKAPAQVIAAAFSAFPSLAPNFSVRLLRRLATRLTNASPLRHHFSDFDSTDHYEMSLQRCAMRAAHLGLMTEALAVDGYVTAKRFEFWSLDRDPHSLQYVVPWMISVAIQAAAHGRTPTIFECLPEQLWRLVNDETAPDSDAEQRALLEKKLKEDAPVRSPEQGDKGARSGLSSSDKHHVADKLRQRIIPILTVTRLLAQLLRSRATDDQNTARAAYFSCWKDAYASAAREPGYAREQRHFINGIYSAIAYHSVSALGLFTPEVGSELLLWMQQSEYLPLTLCIDLIRQFAMSEDCHESAGLMAVEVVKEIRKENDVDYRAKLFARLARALLPANRPEATALFSQGLSELDAIGSGDFAFTNQLLVFAASLQPTPMPAETAIRLAKICEINVYDSHKFPWPLACKAFSKCWGLPYLAQIARWHDRDKVDMELTLPAALSFLAKDRFLAPEYAVALLNLVEPVEMWDWGWHDFVESILETSTANLPVLLNEVLDQLENIYPAGAGERALEGVRRRIAVSPPALAACGPRLDRVAARLSGYRESKNDTVKSQPDATIEGELARHHEDNDAKIKALVEAVDPLNSESIEELVENLDKLDRAFDAKSIAMKGMRAKVKYADRTAHIEAVVAVRNLNLYMKVGFLEDIRAEWGPGSPTQLEFLKQFGVPLVREHASAFMGDDYGSSRNLTNVSTVTGADRDALALVLIETVASGDLGATATAWLSLAAILSSRCTPSVPRHALERLLYSGAARLADTIGDGPWTSALETGNDPAEIAAGLVWFRLGAPEASNRWLAAHTVRAFARLGRWEVIDRMFDKVAAIDAGAFQDRALPFFQMHAKLWFLLSVARLAIDYPKEVHRYSAVLESVALDDSYPHYAMREAARKALLSCTAGDVSDEAIALRLRLDQINQSQFPKSEARTRRSWGGYIDRPAGLPEPSPPFHFEYDFGKYQLTKIGDLFDMPQYEIADRCIGWIRKWDSSIESMFAFAGRPHSGRRESLYEGTRDDFHCYGFYLAEHALTLVAGELLLEKPLVHDRYQTDPWAELVSRSWPTRSDGLWLSDGTGSYPDYALHELLDDPSAKAKVPIANTALLCSLAGIDGSGNIGRALIVSGSWESSDRVDVTIRSVFVSGVKADDAALALVTSPSFEMWLPEFERHDDEEDYLRNRALDNDLREPWVTRPHVETKLDRYDPTASRAAVTRASPCRTVSEKLSIASRDPWSEFWTNSAGEPALWSHVWGHRTGAGEKERWDEGTSLECNRSFLSQMLKTLDRHMVLLIRLQYYRRTERWEKEEAVGEKFAHSHVVAIIDNALRVRLVTPTPDIVAAVEALPPESRRDFEKRLEAIERVRH
jgi:hypothetical protein